MTVWADSPRNLPEYMFSLAGIVLKAKVAYGRGMKDILLVEDDKNVGESLVDGLIQAGYAVNWHIIGGKALKAFRENRPALVVLDLGLPDMDGFQILETFQQEDAQVPVMILSARSEVDSRVQGLENGAVDYLVKPFAFPELLARIRLRLRGALSADADLSLGTLHADCLRRELRLHGDLLEVPPREYDFLVCLLRAKGQAVSREQIARDVWKSPQRMSSLDNLIDVYVSRLRERLQGEGAPVLRTLRGVGYRLEEKR
ncbi:response regulator transcription factor [Kiritimatiellaeota bacterium B1221]|nr:response regulator transcription factor [Kiritimatiellaeota bacterium B1221]